MAKFVSDMGPSVAAANRQLCILLMTRRLPVVARKEHKFMYNNILLYESGNTGDRWRWGVTTASGWLAAVFWSALVNLALHALLTSVSVFPTPSCTKHRQASPERHEYVRCVGGCWISDKWRWGVTTASGWLAAVFWSALVNLALHALLTSVSVFPTPSSCTKHRQASPERHEYVSYPTSEQYMNMANAVLTSFLAILRKNDLEEHELQLQWKLRIQRKFQNSRKRQDSSVTEVTSRKKKIPCIVPKETTCPLMCGVKAYLPPRPHSEDDESLERHRQWLALHWMKKDPELDNQGVPEIRTTSG
ncbi:uncharacterized protein LOC135115982 isoform X4 [Scylla paramamosain]|uniref:uncharacterized protein LOC135115979 isoform X4 n=1 Tax=Scylla paramamosain TaxID=85552 RepID=UPI003082A13F